MKETEPKEFHRNATEKELEEHSNSSLFENVHEDTDVTKIIDEITWSKIVNNANMHLKDRYKMTKQGYTKVCNKCYLNIILC